MTTVRNNKAGLVVAAHRGDAKTLLAFNFTDDTLRKNLAGFTIKVQPPAGAGAAYYLWNSLQFEHPEQHAQVAGEPSYSTVNAPLHRFRWVHVPASDHQGLTALPGQYTYTVTPRYFDSEGHMQALDAARSVDVQIEMGPFESNGIALGFSRGYMQSQAYIKHFGNKLSIKPMPTPLIFDTQAQAGTNEQGQSYRYVDVYQWAGATARQRIVDVLNAVHANPQWQLDVFAYDLNEPDICEALLQLGRQQRVRVILDDASLHKSSHGKTTPEDEFQLQFTAVAGDGAIQRGDFRRYSHDKVFVVYSDTERKTPSLVLSGSTNFSLTGLYVNANHVLVFRDPAVAQTYAQVFEESWADHENAPAFQKSEMSNTTFAFPAGATPRMQVTFSPHTPEMEKQVLQRIVDRIGAEKAQAKGSVLFAVMAIANPVKPGETPPPNPVFDVLKALHTDDQIFSYGISDSPGSVSLYGPNTKDGVLVTGKPGTPSLPPPFQPVPSIGAGHEIHHKFVVCGFGRPDACVVCGSSNLAAGGEQANGDNLITLYDTDIASAFAIEALLLVDHYDFLDRLAGAPKSAQARAAQTGDKRATAKAAEWFLSTNDTWTAPFYAAGSMHARDRALFS